MIKAWHVTALVALLSYTTPTQAFMEDVWEIQGALRQTLGLPPFEEEAEPIITIKELRPSFLQTQVEIMLPASEGQVEIALKRHRLLIQLDTVYGNEKPYPPAFIAKIIAEQSLNETHLFSAYMAAANLSKTEEATRHIMSWAAKFFKPSLSDGNICSITTMIYHYLAKTALSSSQSEGTLLSSDVLSGADHPLPALVQNAQGWREEGDAYTGLLTNALYELLYAKDGEAWQTL